MCGSFIDCNIISEIDRRKDITFMSVKNFEHCKSKAAITCNCLYSSDKIVAYSTNRGIKVIGDGNILAVNTDLNGIFHNTKFTSIDCSKIDFGMEKMFDSMFANCEASSITLGNNMRPISIEAMFYGCTVSTVEFDAMDLGELTNAKYVLCGARVGEVNLENKVINNLDDVSRSFVSSVIRRINLKNTTILGQKIDISSAFSWCNIEEIIMDGAVVGQNIANETFKGARIGVLSANNIKIAKVISLNGSSIDTLVIKGVNMSENEARWLLHGANIKNIETDNNNIMKVYRSIKTL